MLKKQSIIPGRLLQGDYIGIAAPASPFDHYNLAAGVNILKSLGFRLFISEDIFEKKRYLAGEDEQRASLLNRLFADKKIKAIFCARGGFGSLRILPLIDYVSIKNNPKIFIGYSDITAILSAITRKTGLVTFHGPMVTELCTADEKTIGSINSVLCHCGKIEITSDKGVVLKHGSAAGKIAGGNLTTLCHLVGTPYEPDFKGHILLLEEKSEALYRIDRMLTHMKLAGCFAGLAGLVIGSFEECGEIGEIYSIVKNLFKDLDIPILAGFEIGHGNVNLSVPLGIGATLSTRTLKISFDESATEYGIHGQG